VGEGKITGITEVDVYDFDPNIDGEEWLILVILIKSDAGVNMVLHNTYMIQGPLTGSSNSVSSPLVKSASD
jgi:hypothetical protein